MIESLPNLIPRFLHSACVTEGVLHGEAMAVLHLEADQPAQGYGGGGRLTQMRQRDKVVTASNLEADYSYIAILKDSNYIFI